jgi:HEAT repeat protein
MLIASALIGENRVAAGTPGQHAKVIAGLRSKDPDIREREITNLGQVPGLSAPTVKELEAIMAASYAEQIASLRTDPEVVSALFDCFKIERLRAVSLRGLQKLGGTLVESALKRALSSPSLVEDAALGLGYLRSHLAIRELSGLLRSRREQTRIAAAHALGQIGDQSACAALTALLRDHNKYTLSLTYDANSLMGDSLTDRSHTDARKFAFVGREVAGVALNGLIGCDCVSSIPAIEQQQREQANSDFANRLEGARQVLLRQLEVPLVANRAVIDTVQAMDYKIELFTSRLNPLARLSDLKSIEDEVGVMTPGSLGNASSLLSAARGGKESQGTAQSPSYIRVYTLDDAMDVFWTHPKMRLLVSHKYEHYSADYESAIVNYGGGVKVALTEDKTAALR